MLWETKFKCNEGVVLQTIQLESSYVISTQDSYVEGEQLHRNHCQNSLQAVDSVWHRQEIVRKLLRLLVILVTNDNWAPLQKPIHKSTKEAQKSWKEKNAPFLIFVVTDRHDMKLTLFFFCFCLGEYVRF